MNLIDYNKAVEALEKERQLLLNREQYGAENVLVHHAINVIAEMPVIRQPDIVRCKECIFGEQINDRNICTNAGHCQSKSNAPDFFCADGERR